MDPCDALRDVVLSDAIDRETLMARLAEINNIENCVHSGLRVALESEDWDAFEAYLGAAYLYPSRVMTPLLCTVLDRHDRRVPNEDLLEVLTAIADERSVGSLVRALRWEPEWDEFKAIAVKCIWALAAVGTPEAMAALVDASVEGPEVVRDWARSKLAM